MATAYDYGVFTESVQYYAKSSNKWKEELQELQGFTNNANSEIQALVNKLCNIHKKLVPSTETLDPIPFYSSLQTMWAPGEIDSVLQEACGVAKTLENALCKWSGDDAMQPATDQQTSHLPREPDAKRPRVDPL